MSSILIILIVVGMIVLNICLSKQDREFEENIRQERIALEFNREN